MNNCGNTLTGCCDNDKKFTERVGNFLSNMDSNSFCCVDFRPSYRHFRVNCVMYSDGGNTLMGNVGIFSPHYLID